MTRVRAPGLSPAALARRSESALARSEGVREYLVFRIGDDAMGLPLASVKEILKLAQITEVPRASPEIVGILSVRGRITTILDLRRVLHLPDAPVPRTARILLVEHGDEVLGLRVDSVTQVVRLLEKEIESAAVIGGGLSEHVTGIGRPSREGLEENVIVLLDPVALLRS
jgi:purine-binding chemotaxis protein CheW